MQHLSAEKLQDHATVLLISSSQQLPLPPLPFVST